jgi:hypothetical protein
MNAMRGFGELLRDLARDGSELVRGELRLTRVELSSIARQIGLGTAQTALGAVLLLLGGLTLASGIVLLAGDQWLPRDRYWLAALVFVVITAMIAGLLAKRGRAALSPSQLVPDQTLETIRETRNG